MKYAEKLDETFFLHWESLWPGVDHDAVHDEDEIPRHPEGVRDEGQGEVAALHGEQQPGAGRAPVQVVVGVASVLETYFMSCFDVCLA